jgi:D-alanyl-D-alanine-carboxypeptidase/D-alanyl-D-alanine-endopeptidase
MDASPPPVPPTSQQLSDIVQPYLDFANNDGLAIMVGWATPTASGIAPFGGVKNQLGGPMTLTNDTSFELASASKTYTATLYALLTAGQSSSPPLGDFYLGIGTQFANIPIETLVNYTSGLPQDDSNATDLPPLLPMPYSLNGMLGFLNLTSLKPGDFGKAFTYSNLGFALTSAVLPIIYAKNPSPSVPLPVFENLIAALIFEQLGMSGNTCFFTDARLDAFPQGIEFGTDAGPQAAGHNVFPAYHGAGGVVTTPNDMMIWLLYNMGLQQDSVLTPLLKPLQSKATDVTYGANELGLSWFLANTSGPYSNYKSVWKNGGVTGFSSFIAFLPSPSPGTQPSPGGVFVLSNSQGLYNAYPNSSDTLELTGAVAYSVLNVMQGLAPLPGQPST